MRAAAAESQRKVKRHAVQAANARMRSEVLEAAMRSLLDNDEATADGELAGGWNPWVLDPTDGFGATLRVEDPIAMEVLRTPALLARAREIMTEEFGRALFESDETAGFYQALLEDLVVERPEDAHYAAETVH